MRDLAPGGSWAPQLSQAGEGGAERVLPLCAVKVALPSRPRLSVGKALPWTLEPLSLRPVQGAFEHAAPFCRQLVPLPPSAPALSTPGPAQSLGTVSSNQSRVR